MPSTLNLTFKTECMDVILESIKNLDNKADVRNCSQNKEWKSGDFF